MKKRKSIRVFMLLLLNILFLFNLAYSGNEPKKGHELPLCFMENKGQVKDPSDKPVKEVLFTSQVGTTGMFFQKNKVSYIQYNSCIKPDPNLPQSHRVDVEFMNANPNVKIEISDLTGSTYNFYGPTTKGNETSGLKGYKKLSYLNVYPNIDIIYTIKDKQIKYDIIVRPGGNIKDIKFKISGADEVTSANKKTTIVTSLGKITDEIPLTYYDDETKTKVNVSLHQKGNVITFKGNAIDRTKTLIIDPALAFFDNTIGPSTAGSESVGNANNISWGYGTTIVGYSNDPSFASLGRYISTGTPHTPQKVAFISFFDLNGTHQWYSSVETNTGSAIFNDVMVIGNSYIVACGQVNDDGLPNPTSLNGYTGYGWDGFVASFLANGTLGQTYCIGGVGDDVATCITNGLTFLDRYIVGGYSDSPYFTTPNNSYEDWASHTNTCGFSNNDGFLFNFRIMGSTMFVPVKYTFVGSCYDEKITDVDYKNNYVAPAGAKLYVTGITTADDATAFTPAVASAITSNSSAGDLDVFVLSLTTPNGSTGPWNFGSVAGTFLGDDAGDETTPRIDVSFEPTGAGCTNSDVYVSFVTNSSGLNSITTGNAYQSNLNSKDNFFVSLDYQLGTVNYASYFNAAVANPLTTGDLPLSIKADWLGNKYLCSITDQSAFPYTDLITQNGNYPGTPGGNYTDIFLARLNPDYSLAYQALTGSDDVDYATEIDVQQAYYGLSAFCDNPVFITGASYVDPVANNPVNAVNCRVNDQYVLSLSASPPGSIPSVLTLLNACYLSNMGIPYTVQWYHDGSPVINPSGDLFSFTAGKYGDYYVTISTAHCTLSSNNVTFNPPPPAPKATNIKEVGQVSDGEIKVYPNPSNSSFQISLDNMNGATNVVISDLLGRAMYSQTIENTSKLNVNCSDWNNGIYIIKIYNGDHTVKTIKLTKVN